MDIDIDAHRNEDLLRVVAVTDGTEPIDVTSRDALFVIAKVAGTPSNLLEVGSVPTTNGSRLTVENGAQGQLSILLKRADQENLPGGAEDISHYAYNLILNDTGSRRVVMRGHLTIYPGV